MLIDFIVIVSFAERIHFAVVGRHLRQVAWFVVAAELLGLVVWQHTGQSVLELKLDRVARC